MRIHFISSVIMALFRHSKLLGDVHLIVFFLLDILSFSISDYEIETFLDFHQSVFCKAKPNHMLQVHKYNFSIQTLICCAITVAHVGGKKGGKLCCWHGDSECQHVTRQKTVQHQRQMTWLSKWVFFSLIHVDDLCERCLILYRSDSRNIADMRRDSRSFRLP